MCYLSIDDVNHVDSVCSDLLVDLPEYGDGKKLEAAGGEYGCWLAPDVDEQHLFYACTSGFGHATAMSKCSTCKTLVVCIKYPETKRRIPEY